MTILHAFLALLGGFLTMALPVAIITAVLMRRAPAWVADNGHPRPAYITVNLAYSLLAAIAGGYVTACIASEDPLRYALMLAVIVLLFSGVSAVQPRGRQRVLYQLILLLLSPACVLFGGWIRYISHFS